MGATSEAHQSPIEEYRASYLKRPLTLRRRNLRLCVELDGSVRFLESMSEGRLLFGREQLSFFRAKAGVLLQAQRTDWKLRPSPYSIAASTNVFDSIEASQRIGILPAPVEGFYRAVSVKNTGAVPAKMRLVGLQDPTAAHFRDAQFGWGSLGVNAFNRSTHVAMDEVAGPPSARVLGSRPGPKLFFMTSDKGKATDLLAAGELPEQTAGMSGQVIVLAQYDLEIPAGSTVELSMFSLYDQDRLESALSNFEKLTDSVPTEGKPEFEVSSSSSGITTAAKWAVSALECAPYESDMLDRYETLRALPYVGPESARVVIESSKVRITKDGWIGHSLDPLKPGILETSALLVGVSIMALLTSEKKYARAVYPAARKLAGYLLAASPQGTLKTDASLPQGWRRRIGKGYPTGEIPEVSLSAAGALASAAQLASLLGKREDSSRWEEASKLMVRALNERATEERGLLSLCLDDEKVRTEETVDQAVACYRCSPGTSIESHVVRRLLEKDFESGWGPRTVPTSNKTYFNPSYGEGQLGGYWTRAALAHAITAYKAGLAGIGSAELEAISRLASAESAKFGGAPGEFPYWIDPQRHEVHGSGSDPVSAARFLEAVVGYELGLRVGPQGPEVSPSRVSRLKWLLISGLYAGKRACFFVGKADDSSFVLAGVPECRVEKGWCFSNSERVSADDGAVAAASFFSPGQAVCIGNSSEATVKTRVSFAPRDPALSKHLSVKLQRLDKVGGSWEVVSPIRVLSPMTFEVSLGPRDWGVFRLSTGS